MSDTAELREKAKLLRGCVDSLTAPYIIPSTKELMALTMLDSAHRMEDAADELDAMAHTRWAELFGTPERAARTLVKMELDDINWHQLLSGDCDGCPLVKSHDRFEDCEPKASLLEWLEGGAE